MHIQLEHSTKDYESSESAVTPAEGLAVTAIRVPLNDNQILF